MTPKNGRVVDLRAEQRLKTTLRVMGTFKSVYFDYKSRANTEVPQNPWRIQNTALFPRLDAFLERCHDLHELALDDYDELLDEGFGRELKGRKSPSSRRRSNAQVSQSAAVLGSNRRRRRSTPFDRTAAASLLSRMAGSRGTTRM